MFSIVIAATMALQSLPPIPGCMPNSGGTPPTPVMIEPTVITGGAEDSPLFRVSSAVLTEDLALAVANRGSNEILLFGPDGSLEGRLGGTGEGPSEFRRLRQVHWMEGDRLAATGGGLRKVVVMDPRDGFVVTHSFRDLRIQTVLPLPRDKWLVYSISPPDPEPGGGRFWVEGRLTLHDRNGRMEREIRAIPAFELIDMGIPGGGGTRGFPPFWKGTHISVDDTGCVWLARDYDATVEVLDLTGRRRGALSLREKVRMEVTQDEWDEEIERIVQRGDPSSHARFRRMLGEVPFDPLRPAFSGMEVDDEGHTWVAPYHRSDTDVEGWWLVAGLGVDAIWVPAPPGTRRLLEVRYGHVVLLHVSRLGVETVSVRPIRYK